MPRRLKCGLVIVATFTLAGVCVLGWPGSARAAFQISQQTFTAAGGPSASASFQLWSCLRPEALAGGKSTSPSYILYAGCGGAFPAGLPADDDDGDGVPNGVEDTAPSGDGNADGIADRLQGWVASQPAATGLGTLTLEACADQACANTCQLEEVRALAEEDLPEENPDLLFPFGLLEFTLRDCSPAYMHVLYHGSDGFVPQVQYVKYGPNPPGPNPEVYYVLPGVVFGVEAVGADPAVASATFTLWDYQLGDDDGVAGINHIIIDQGGPAFESNAVPAPALSRLSLGLALVVLMLVSLLAMRRARRSAERQAVERVPGNRRT